MKLEDVDIAIKISKASTSNICRRLPLGVTNRDVSRLKDLNLCDQLPDGAIVLCYNLMELEEMHGKLIQQQKETDIQDANERAQRRKEAIRKAAKMLPALLYKLFEACKG